MRQKHNIFQKVTALVLTAVMLIGGGTPANMLCAVLTAAAAESEAPIASAAFTAPKTITKFLAGTAKSEEPLRKTVNKLVNECPNTNYKQFEEKGYSVLYSTNLETDFAILYNPAHVDIPAVLSTPNGQAWAHTYSRYLTALSQITGTNVEFLLTVIDTDIIYDGVGVFYGPFTIITKRWAYEVVTAMLNNKISWTLMHEASHCYADNLKTYSCFNSDDDIYCNLRGLLAFHLMGIEKEKMIIEHASSRLISTDCDLEDKYKESELFPTKDPKYQALYPKGSTLWSRPEYDSESSVSLSFLQSFLAEACADSEEHLYYARLAAILDLVTEKRITSSYSDDPTDCNNWRNTDAINANLNTISDESWQKLLALCIVHEEQTAVPGINDKVRALYQNYTGQMTEKVQYSQDGEKVYTVKVTPNVQKMLRKLCKNEDGIYRILGTEIQIMNMYDFMGEDFETTVITHYDADGKYTRTNASSFFLDSGLRLSDYAYRGFAADPAITKQPVQAVAAAVDSATFSISAEGENLTYQWQFYDGTSWKDSTASGYNTDTVRVTANPAWEGRLYRCKVSYPNGEYELSQSASLHIRPKVETETTSVEAKIGKELVFSAEATGTGTLSYQWQYNDGTEWKDSTAKGADSASVRVSVTAERDGLRYRCIVTSENGTSEISDFAAIQVPVKIIKQPADVSTETRKVAEFSVEASGGKTLFYQWQYSDGAGWDNSEAPGADTASMRMTVKERYDGLQYRCIVSSSSGMCAFSDTVTLKVMTAILTHPESMTIGAGEQEILTVEASGAGALGYQWQYNDGTGWKNTAEEGAKTDRLHLTGSVAHENRKYRCVVTSSNGSSAASNAATIKINATITKQPENAELKIGENAVFTVAAAGVGTLSYQWQYNNGSGWKDSTAKGADTASVTLNMKASYENIKYRCIVKSSNGTEAVSCTAMIRVSVKITKQPANVTLTAGKNAVFTVAASGGGTLSYQWQYKSGAGWTNSSAHGADTASLAIPVTAARDGLQYRCIVTSTNATYAVSDAAVIHFKRIMGDANADGAVTVADAIMMQKWLLCAGDLTDWQAADMNGDKKINAADFTLLKRKLLAS